MIRPIYIRGSPARQLKRLIKGLKWRTKVVEVFWGPGALEKLVYLVLVQKNEKLVYGRPRWLAKIQSGSCYAPRHSKWSTIEEPIPVIKERQENEGPIVNSLASILYPRPLSSYVWGV